MAWLRERPGEVHARMRDGRIALDLVRRDGAR
jgi:hypothetical protein